MKKFYKKYGFYTLIAYLVLSYFYMPLGIIAIICMVSPILFAAIGKGRYWCGNFCPRGLFFQNVTGRFSKNKAIPKILKSVGFRLFMVIFIISNFGIGVYQNWGDVAGIGFVFYRIIIITTIFGIIINTIYMPRTWCAFCPMGSIATFITKCKRNQGSCAKTICKTFAH